MLRTFIQQNEDWFANSDHPFSRFGEMESEIAELRTMTKVTQLRKQIECREEGAWVVVKDVPDENAPSGSRKVTSYGRTRRSVVRSISSNADFGGAFSPGPVSNEPLVQHPEEDDYNDSKPSTVEITEVFDEPLRVNVVDNHKNEEKPQTLDKTSQKKSSVVTLGKGNLVLIGPEDESNFHVTGISKGKVADVVSTLEKTSEKKPKKVGFCKTEVHFAPDSGKINIVETDEKPPPTQVYRKKKRSRTVKSKGTNCLPKHYFGEIPDLGDDSNLSNESDKEESRPPLLFSAPADSLPEVKQIFPTFERTIKSEGKDVKYRHSSPEKSDTDFGVNSLLFEDKEIFRKLKQPAFREKFLKETETSPNSLPSVSCKIFGDSSTDSKAQKSTVNLNESGPTVNGLISRHHVFEKDKFSSFSLTNHLREKAEQLENTEQPELKYTELFKISVKNENVLDDSTKHQDLKSVTEIKSSDYSEKNSHSDYGFVQKEKISTEERQPDLLHSISRVPIDQDIKPDITFLGSVSPKLKNLIQNSVEHEFQLRQKQILQKRSLEKKIPTNANNSHNVKSTVNIKVQGSNERVEKIKSVEQPKPQSKKSVTQVTLENDQHKHEFQLKREEIAKNLETEPLYGNKEFELKETPFLLSEEPVPAPRERTKIKTKVEKIPNEPPKPKPRTILSSQTDRSRHVKTTSRQSMKSDSSLSRRVRSKESLNRLKDSEKTHSRPPQHKEDIRSRRLSSSSKSDGTAQKLTTKSTVQTRKVVRSEPLRSFEKVSNGWVGVIPGGKSEGRNSPKITVTSHRHKALSQQSSHHDTGTRRSIQSSTTIRSLKSADISKGGKQFSLSKEHLSSAKLVKELSPRRSSARTKTEVKVLRPRTARTTEASSNRIRRDSNDSVVQADEEVRAYMFNSRSKK